MLFILIDLLDVILRYVHEAFRHDIFLTLLVKGTNRSEDWP